MQAASKILLDHDGNVIVGGATENKPDSNTSYRTLIKYSSDGTRLWNNVSDKQTTAYDILEGLFCDAGNNLYTIDYVHSYDLPGKYQTKTVAVAAKFNPAGKPLWEQDYLGEADYLYHDSADSGAFDPGTGALYSLGSTEVAPGNTLNEASQAWYIIAYKPNQ